MFRGSIVPLLAIAVLIVVGWSACSQGRRAEEAAERDAVYLLDFWEEPADGGADIQPISPEPNPRVRGFYDAVNQAGAKVYLVAEPRGDTRTINVRMRIPEEAIETVGDTQLADLDLGGVEIRVVQLLTPTATTPDTTHDGRTVVEVPHAPGRDLFSVFLLKTYTQKRQMEQLERPVLDTVSSWEVKDEFPGLISTETLQVPVDNCDTAAIQEVGDEVVDTAVTFHPIAGCGDEKCKEVYVAWLRAYHDVKIILQMLEHIDNQASYDQRAAYWREPWADQGGNELPDTSLEYYFGEFDQDRFRIIRDAYRYLRKIMTYPEDLELDWKFVCDQSPLSKCVTTNDVAAFHGPWGYIGLCAPFFSQAGDEPEQLVRRAKDRVRLLVHESLHHRQVSWVDGSQEWIDDRHDHRHGDDCDRVLTKVDDRKWCQVLHLAVYPGPFPDGEEHCADQMVADSAGCKGCGGCSVGDHCSHHDLATINNDTYGYATSEIGAGLRRQDAHHWPSAQYPSSPDDSCVDDVPNPENTLDTCVYSMGSLNCAGSSIPANDITNMVINCD